MGDTEGINEMPGGTNNQETHSLRKKERKPTADDGQLSLLTLVFFILDLIPSTSPGYSRRPLNSICIKGQSKGNNVNIHFSHLSLFKRQERQVENERRKEQEMRLTLKFLESATIKRRFRWKTMMRRESRLQIFVYSSSDESINWSRMIPLLSLLYHRRGWKTNRKMNRKTKRKMVMRLDQQSYFLAFMTHFDDDTGRWQVSLEKCAEEECLRRWDDERETERINLLSLPIPERERQIERLLWMNVRRFVGTRLPRDSRSPLILSCSACRSQFCFRCSWFSGSASTLKTFVQSIALSSSSRENA